MPAIGVSLLRAIQRRMLEVVLLEFVVFTLLGLRFHEVFAGLKPLIPVLGFAMLLQPMYAMRLGAGLLRRLRGAALAAMFILYALVYPVVTLAFTPLWLAILPASLHQLLAGVLLVALSPVAMPAPAFVAMLGGSVELSVASVVITFLAAPFVIPAYTLLALHHVVHLPAVAVIRSILLFIVAPLAVAQAAKTIAYRAAGGGVRGAYAVEKVGLLFAWMSTLSLCAIIAVAFGNAAPVIARYAYYAALLVAALLAYNAVRHCVAFLAARLLRLNREDEVALVYVGSQNGALGMALAAGLGSVEALVGAVLAGPIAVILAMSAVAKIYARRASRRAQPPSPGSARAHTSQRSQTTSP